MKKKWQVNAKYAENPPIVFEAKTFDDAMIIAESLARSGHAMGGYLPGGGLCPVEVK